MNLPASPLSGPSTDAARGARARLAHLASVRMESGGVAGVALQLFEQMRTGELDRTQLSSEYSAQLTDEAVQQMSHYLTRHQFGVPPKGAQVVLTRSNGGQKFHVVRLHYPRGDATSLLLGFDGAGKITGVILLGMAGD
jgi:hypothetical protein